MGYILADTCIVDLAVLLATIIGLLYYWSIATFSYWDKKGVKSLPNPVPLVGSMWPAISFKRQFGLHFEDIYKAMKDEKFVGFYKFRDPSLMIRDPALIKHIVLKDFASFTDNDIVVNENSDPMLAHNLFSMKGDKWKYARSKFSPVFSSGKIRNMFPLMKDVCKELKAHIQSKIDSGNPEFNAKQVAANYTTDNVASCAFGIKCTSLRDENNEFRKMGKAVMEPTPFKATIMFATFFWPSLSSIMGYLGVKFINDAVLNFFRKLVHDAMDFREKNSIHRNDLIQLLMQLKKKGEIEEDEEEKVSNNGTSNGVTSTMQKFDFSDDVLTAQAVGFFFDGFETSSITLCMAMHELMMNPHVQNRLRDELKKSMDNNRGELTYDGIRECAYLDQVFMETLRKYPVIGALSKTCTQRYILPDTNIHIEVGTSVTLPVQGLHYDPQYFPDPETFDPERFNEENKKNIIPHTFMPFGGGPRQCIGMRFALTQIKIALATIITNFELQRTENTKHPITLDPHFFMVSPLGGLPMKAVPL